MLSITRFTMLPIPETCPSSPNKITERHRSNPQETPHEYTPGNHSGNISGNEALIRQTRQLEPQSTQSRTTSPLSRTGNAVIAGLATFRQHSGNVRQEIGNITGKNGNTVQTPQNLTISGHTWLHTIGKLRKKRNRGKNGNAPAKNRQRSGNTFAARPLPFDGRGLGVRSATSLTYRHSLHCPAPRPMVYSFCLTLVNTKGPLDETGAGKRWDVSPFRT